MRTSEFLDKVSNLKSIVIDIFGSKLFNLNINSIKIRLTHIIFLWLYLVKRGQWHLGWWHGYVGDLMLVAICGWCWLNLDVGDMFWMSENMVYQLKRFEFWAIAKSNAYSDMWHWLLRWLLSYPKVLPHIVSNIRQ